MKIYFAANIDAVKLKNRYQKITDILTNAGNTVMSNLNLNRAARFSENEVEQFRSRGETLLEQMDALVVDATVRSPENGYLVALSLTHKKPTLFLHEAGTEVDQNLITLQRDKYTSNLLQIQKYNEQNLRKVIVEFLGIAEKKGGHELPRIKFTLRITPKMERFLHYKTHNSDKSKADFLRDELEKMMEEDPDFKKYI